MKINSYHFKSISDRKDFLVSAFKSSSANFDFVEFLSKDSYSNGCRNITIYESEHFGLDKSHCLAYLISFVNSNKIHCIKLDDVLSISFSIKNHNKMISLTFSNELPF